MKVLSGRKIRAFNAIDVPEGIATQSGRQKGSSGEKGEAKP
jgi:hypothetical protein